MSESWALDPATGDYILDAFGNPTIDNGLKTPAYVRLRAHRLQWQYAPDTQYGSDFYAFKIRRSTSDQKSTKALAARALKPMLVDKRASSISISIIKNTRNMTQFSAKIIDAEGNPEKLELAPIGGN